MIVLAKRSFIAYLAYPRGLSRLVATRTPYVWRGIFLSAPGIAGVGIDLRCDLRNVVPWMLLEGMVGANVGRFFARTLVAASNPEANLISVGSLNAVPKKLIPSGTPNTMPAGTCTIGYPSGAARLEVPKMKWSP